MIDTEYSKNISDLIMFDDMDGALHGYFNSTSVSMKNDTTFDANANQFNYSGRQSLTFRNDITGRMETIVEQEVERPLLEELEIYPNIIQQKAIIMINPFASDELAGEQFLAGIDLFGPIFFCFLFGVCLFLAGKVFIFSHVYSLSMISIVGMYGLMKLLNYGEHGHLITIRGVASALGYGLLHLVWFSFIGIFMRLNTVTGLALASPAIVLATLGASRILNVMSIKSMSGALIAYPTAIIYILFAFLVAF